jgi:hypothetical protein
MQVKIDSNFHEIERLYSGMKKQVRFAAAVALTRTVKDAQSDTPGALDRDLEKPVDFTKRGTFTIPARKDDLAATLGFKDKQARYMALQIAGGVYRPGDAGIKLPGNIQLNAFGNIPKGLIAKLKAAAKDGSLSTAIARRVDREINSDSDAGGQAYRRLNQHGNRRKQAAPLQLFYGRPTGKGWDGAPVGIWRRIPPATPGGKGKLIPIIVFEQTPAVYRARFNLRDHLQSAADRRFAAHFKAELSKALSSAR